MKFKIDNQIFEKFPDLNIGIVVAKGIDNKGNNEEIIKLIKEKQNEIKASFNKEELPQNPKIGAWRKAYSSFGAKPKKYKCSVENLYRMILDDVELKHINKVVDIYNYMSIKHLTPIGGDDMDKIERNLILTIAKGDEKFKELNSEEIKNPKESEVVYRDDKEVLCRRWNWRECDKSKMTENSENIILVTEGLSPVTKEEVESIIKELSEMIKKYCGGIIKTEILNKKNDSIEL